MCVLPVKYNIPDVQFCPMETKIQNGNPNRKNNPDPGVGGLGDWEEGNQNPNKKTIQIPALEAWETEKKEESRKKQARHKRAEEKMEIDVKREGRLKFVVSEPRKKWKWTSRRKVG
jgi:hypothetical protein